MPKGWMVDAIALFQHGQFSEPKSDRKKLLHLPLDDLWPLVLLLVLLLVPTLRAVL